MRGKYSKVALKLNALHQSIFGKASVHVQEYYCIDYIRFWNKVRHFPIQFRVTTSWLLSLAEAFRNDYVAAYSTTILNATEYNE